MAEQIVLTDLVNLQNETTAVTAINSNNNTIEEAFLDVLSLSGTAPNQMQSPLDMNNNRILNLPAPVNPTDPVRLEDLTGEGLVVPTPGGNTGALQYNNAGTFGGFTPIGDVTVNTSTGALTVTKTNGSSFAPSATTDTTNASNISSGTVTVARLPVATSSTQGIVKPDNTTITISGGTISAVGGGGSTPGGTSGQIEYNNAGSFGGFTATGDATITPSTGAVVVTKTNGVAFSTSATTDATNATNITSGTLGAARLPTLTGDATNNSSGAVTVSRTGGVAFATSATTDTTSATNITSGTLSAARLPAITGDGSLTAGTLTVTKTSGSAFAPSATTDTTNATNITSGTVAAARLPVATSSVNGVVKPDGTTITIAGGVISSVSGGTGTVTSVGLALPSDITVTGSPVTSSGTLTGAWATTPTGTGAIVRATSPTLVTPALGTPSAINLTNGTALPIGGVTGLGANVAGSLAIAMASTGALVSASSPTITTPNIVGTTAGGNASAGSVGEYVSSQLLPASQVTLTTGTPANVTSISLTAGDWDVSGNVGFNPNGTTAISAFGGFINTVSATIPTNNYAAYTFFQFSTTGLAQVIPINTLRISISTTTTVYLIVTSNFTVASNFAYGFIGARRVR